MSFVRLTEIIVKGTDALEHPDFVSFAGYSDWLYTRQNSPNLVQRHFSWAAGSVTFSEEPSQQPLGQF